MIIYSNIFENSENSEILEPHLPYSWVCNEKEKNKKVIMNHIPNLQSISCNWMYTKTHFRGTKHKHLIHCNIGELPSVMSSISSSTRLRFYTLVLYGFIRCGHAIISGICEILGFSWDAFSYVLNCFMQLNTTIRLHWYCYRRAVDGWNSFNSLKTPPGICLHRY